MTRWKRKWNSMRGITAVIFLLTPLFVQIAQANTPIIVDGTTCTLPDALTAANSNTPTGGCPAGTDALGFDIIELQNDVTLSTSPPQITSNIHFEGNDYTIDGNDMTHIFHVNAAGEFVLNHVIITGGVGQGAAVRNNFGTVTIRNSIFHNNWANGTGGIIWNVLESNTMHIENSIIRDNSSIGTAGSIRTGVDTILTITNSLIENNQGGEGGGLFIFQDANVIINNTTIRNNSSVEDGNGGGIFLKNADQVTINNSTIHDNVATEGDLSNGWGGGIAVEGVNDLVLNNVTISGNDAQQGGGLAFFGGVGTKNVVLNNVTITQNGSVSAGGGIDANVDYTTVLNRTIVSGNLAPSGEDIENSGSMIGNNYNLIGSGGSAKSVGFTPSGSDITPNGPTSLVLDLTLADNGGPTWSHALASNSLARDKAPNADCTADPINGVDQRGASRNFDLNGSGTTHKCDIGAFEAHQVIEVGGLCAFGAELSGPQTFAFNSGNTVTINVNTANGLRCLSVEEMGPVANHPLAHFAGFANLGLLTEKWWHISGNVDSGFDVDITLPYGAADGDSRLCRWNGTAGTVLWACSGAGSTTFVSNGSVTQAGVTSFSDWTVGDGQAETAVLLTMLPTGFFDWSIQQPTCLESLHSSPTPYSGHDEISTDPANYDGSGSLTNTAVNYFYYLQTDCAGRLAKSNEVGEFTFSIVPGN